MDHNQSGRAISHPTGSGMITTAANSSRVGDSPSKIRDCVSYTEEILSDLHSAITELDQRLDTVLTPEPPSTLTNLTHPVPVSSSHLFNRLAANNDMITSAITRLRALAQRVEI